MEKKGTIDLDKQLKKILKTIETEEQLLQNLESEKSSLLKISNDKNKENIEVNIL